VSQTVGESAGTSGGVRPLAGRVAVVTGASRGIGAAIAIGLADAGAAVGLLARDAASLAGVAERVRAGGGRAEVAAADVTDREALAAALDTLTDALGLPDVVVNNAGGTRFSAPLVDVGVDGWVATMRLNLEAVLAVCQHLGPRMLARGSGSVINVASVAGVTGTPGMGHYGAAKAAVISLTRTLAVEWAPQGVRVNALLPGWVATDLTDFARRRPEVEDQLLARVPMGRWGEPAELVGPAVFLASDASSFMTGQTLVVDGGLTAG
jgi:2-deoxy-D-gluconate 3-dehydrogenase